MRPSPDDVGNGATKVLLVDIEERTLPALGAVRADGSRWSGVWIFVRSLGRVVGVTEITFADRDTVSADKVRQLVDSVAADKVVQPLTPVPDSDLPRASVVVASDLKRRGLLRACLIALVDQRYPDFELIVVDNHRGTDADGVAQDLVAGLPGIRVVREPVPGLSAARNAGTRAAKGDFVAFTDDDVLVDGGWLRAIGTRFALRADEEVVTGLVLPTDLETTAQLWFERHYGGFAGPRTFEALTYRGAGPQAGLARRSKVTVLDWQGREVRRFAGYGAGVCGAGANMAFRADTLRRLGGFDQTLGAGTPAGSGEDLALFISHLWNGGSIGYEPGAVVSHSHRADYAALRDQLYNYGLGFTALMTSLVIADPRHIAGVLSQLPALVRSRIPQRSRASDEGADGAATEPVSPEPRESAVPRELKWLELRGALHGPSTYLRSHFTPRRPRSRAGRRPD